MLKGTHETDYVLDLPEGLSISKVYGLLGSTIASILRYVDCSKSTAATIGDKEENFHLFEGLFFAAI